MKNSVLKFEPKKTAFLIPNLGIFIIARIFAVRQIRRP